MSLKMDFNLINQEVKNKVLFAQIKSGKAATLLVTGCSMEPTLYEGDSVTIQFSNEYAEGDIVVFIYKNNELLIHRLLCIRNERYYCKGDNALRLEDINYSQIVGKVIMINGTPILKPPSYLVPLSLLVNRSFHKNKYNVDITRQSGIYRFYMNYLTKNEDNSIIYEKNKNLEYIHADDTSLVVYISENDTIFLFDSVGINILNCLEEPCTIDELLSKLCKIYDSTSNLIRIDVEDFLVQTIANNIVLVK